MANAQSWFPSEPVEVPAAENSAPARMPSAAPFEPSSQPSPANAKPPTPPELPNTSPSPIRHSFGNYKIQLQAVVGLGTIVGLAGATLGLNLHERVNIGGGIGTNLLGLQGEGFVRVRPIVTETSNSKEEPSAFAIELAYASGPSYGSLLGHGDQGDQPDYSWKLVRWLQAGAVYEKMISRYFAMLLGGSLAFPLASRDCNGTAVDRPHIVCDSNVKPKPLLGFTFAIGPVF